MLSIHDASEPRILRVRMGRAVMLNAHSSLIEPFASSNTSTSTSTSTNHGSDGGALEQLLEEHESREAMRLVDREWSEEHAGADCDAAFGHVLAAVEAH